MSSHVKAGFCQIFRGRLCALDGRFSLVYACFRSRLISRCITSQNVFRFENNGDILRFCCDAKEWGCGLDWRLIVVWFSRLVFGFLVGLFVLAFRGEGFRLF